MSIVLDGTSGITTPALDSDGSLTLGTAVMAVPTGDAPLFACRAWVNFDGTKDTTGAASTANTNRLIRGSGNVTSVLRNGAGDYTITFTTALPDANYSAVFGNAWSSVRDSGTSGATTTTLTVITGFTSNTSGGGTGADASAVQIAIFR